MIVINRLLLLSLAIVLGSHTLLSRGLDYDGSYNLLYMTVLNGFYNVELSRKIFDVFYQLPAWLFIKFSPSPSLSLLTVIHSFGLIWIHALSIGACFLMLPKDQKSLLFFPLFAFLTGPMTGLGISVSAGLSVCSYVWLIAFVIYYSDLSLLRHRLAFVFGSFLLLFSHELTSYMALPLIGLCIFKYQKESDFLNRFFIFFTAGILVLSSFLAFFLFFSHNTVFDNRKSFMTSLKDLEFIYFHNRFNFPVLISLFLIGFLFLSLFQWKGVGRWRTAVKAKNSVSKNLFFVFYQSLFDVWIRIKEKMPFVLFLCISFISFYFLFFWFFKVPIDFPMEDDYRARVWSPSVALPLSFLCWWVFKDKTVDFCFKKYKWFLLSIIVVVMTFTSWRLRSDWLFYRHRSEFSKVLSRFQGVLDWNSVQDSFSNIIFSRKIELWKITSASLLYPASMTVKAVLMWSYSDCMNYCNEKGGKDDDSTYHCHSFCENKAFKFQKKEISNLSRSRFFDFSGLKGL